MPGTHPTDPILDAFESHRARLRAVAYRVLGSDADAEDVVQEAWRASPGRMPTPSTTSAAG
ncbi:sigma factor [Micromonospora citrea]|uniref:sigma factor n=1 Tax=Micromonospora citrea TaxID=47855 RepID=UPI000A4FA6E8|nr:sigma factor [Micromonospora citrea]